MDEDDEAFLDAVLASPDDDTVRLVYADLLDERADPRGAFLRVECELVRHPEDDGQRRDLRARWRELYPGLDPDWLGLVRRVPLDPLDELRLILPPPARPFRAAGDWAAIETALGTPLPTDYKAFVTVYGSGTIGCLEITSPFGVGGDIRDWWVAWSSYYHDVAEYIDNPYPVFPEPGGLLPFGTLGDSDFLNWRTVGDPDAWPFVYYTREGDFVEVKGLSTVEFVLEAVTGRSPVLIRVRRETALDQPCDFEPHTPDPRWARFVLPAEIDHERLATRLAGLWPPNRVRVRRVRRNVRLLVEPLSGTINLHHEGDGRTYLSIHYDASGAAEAEMAINEVTKAGFVAEGESP